jgi:hypothetical protein
MLLGMAISGGGRLFRLPEWHLLPAVPVRCCPCRPTIGRSVRCGLLVLTTAAMRSWIEEAINTVYFVGLYKKDWSQLTGSHFPKSNTRIWLFI